MTQIVNFNKKKKEKTRADDKKRAEHNRVKFGRTKEEKELERLKAEKARKHIDAHKMEDE